MSDVEQQEESAEELELVEPASDESDGAEGSETEPLPESDDAAEEEAEVSVSIGDEELNPPEEGRAAPEWVRELRKNYRELQRDKRELEKRLAATQQVAPPQAVTVGQKPTLAECEFDSEVFEKRLADWYEQKRASDEAETRRKDAEDRNLKEYRETLATYDKAKAALKVPDFEDAESAALNSLTQIQQGIIVQGAENPALVIYALGKNPKKAKEISAISDPVKFSFAVAKLETQLKVTPRKAAASPEAPVRGAGRTSGAVDSTLDRLRAKAEKSGDYSEVVRFKQQQRAKKAS